MSKFKAPSLAGSGIIRPKAVAAPEIRDDEIPAAEPNVLPDLTAVPEANADPVPAKRGKAAKRQDVEPKELAQRPLYARPETLDLIRTIAFEKRTTAQALYREGLFLMLRKHGYFKDKTLNDV